MPSWLAHQESGEVPLDGPGAQHGWSFGREPAEQGTGMGAVDVGLGHERKAHAEVQAAEAGPVPNC